MRVLVTGGAGFIGTNLVKKLLDNNDEVISVDNYSTGFEKNHQKGCTYHKIDFAETDLKYLSWINPDIVYHIGALARIQPSFERPTDSFNTNVLGTQYIMDYIREYKIPLIYAGSSSVHGDKYSNPYTFTKWLGEEVVTMYNRIYNVKSVICRFYNVYGKYQVTEGDYCNVLGIFQRQYDNGQPLTITGDGEQRRDFTSVDDIVDGLVRCGWMLLSNREHKVNGEIFELGSGYNYSINEIADAFGDYEKEYIDAMEGEMRETLNTDTKAVDVLGWNPTGNIIEYIKKELVNEV